MNSTATSNGMANNGLTPDEIRTIVAFERAGAALSVFSLLWIFIAFGALKRLRTVPNTFIVFASFANLGASIACLIGYNGIDAGKTSPLCQAQAFMFELFMQSDPWWSFAMAVNVFMVFFFAANPRSFLTYWWVYFIVCYGIPFIPSLWLLLVRDDQQGLVYGDATLWCWIDQRWSGLRIYTYYLPIWVCIFLSTAIYVSVGFYVFQQRNQLRNLSLSDPSRDGPGQRDSAEKRLFTSAAGVGSVATEVTQTTTIHPGANSQDARAGSPGSNINWFGVPMEPSSAENHPGPATCQTVTHISARSRPKRSWYSHILKAYTRWCNKFKHMDPVKLAYLRTSFVFAISVLVTWTPSSINRVHDLVARNGASFGLNLASAIVLPLQGVWNGVIFFSTSWKPLIKEMNLIVNTMKGLPRGHETANTIRNERERGMELEHRLGRQVRDDAASERTASSTMRVVKGGSLTSL